MGMQYRSFYRVRRLTQHIVQVVKNRGILLFCITRQIVFTLVNEGFDGLRAVLFSNGFSQGSDSPVPMLIEEGISVSSFGLFFSRPDRNS